MMLPLPKNIILDAYVDPDTLSTLEIGTLYGNTNIQNGSGNFILYDANKAETINFYFGSQQESISFLRSGNNLFRGSFTFSNKSIQPKFRIPKDISYSKDFAKIRFSILGEDGQEAIGAVSNIILTPGPPSTDIEGPIITIETESGRLLRSGDHIKKNDQIKIRISDPS